MDKRRMCPHCRAMITADEKVCPYCDAKLGSRAIDMRVPDDLLGGLMPGNRFVTSMLLLVNGLIFLTLYLSDNRYFLVSAWKDGRGILLRGEFWRLITAGYLHKDLLHIAMNAFAIFQMGAVVEELYGAKRMFTSFTVATICGFLASSLWNPTIPSLGASAGAFGLIGALIAYGVNSKTPMGDAMKKYYIESAVFSVLVTWLLNFPIDNAAHLGGLAGGFVTSWLADQPRLINDWKEQAWSVAAAVSLLITVGAFVQMYLFFVTLSPK